MLLAAQLTRLNREVEITLKLGIGSIVERFTYREKAPWTPAPALPLTQRVGLAAAGADGQDSGVAPQLLLGGFVVRGTLLWEAPQQVGSAGSMERIYFRNQLCSSELSVSMEWQIKHRLLKFCPTLHLTPLREFWALSPLSYLPGEVPKKKKLIYFCFLLHRF